MASPTPIPPTRRRWTTGPPRRSSSRRCRSRSVPDAGFTDADREDTQPVAIVSESLARRHWPDADPIGKRIKLGTGPWMTVVGVSGDRHPRLVRPPQLPDALPAVPPGPDRARWRSSSALARPVDARGRCARGRSRRGSVAAGLRAAVDAPGAAGADDRPAVRRRDHARLRRPRAAAGGGRRLRRHGAHGHAAHARDRRAHGARRHAPRRPPAHGRADREADRDRRRRSASCCRSLLGRLIEAGLLGVASSDARITAGLAAILVVVGARSPATSPRAAPRRSIRPSRSGASERVTSQRL